MSLISLKFLLGFLPVVAIGTHVLHDRFSARAAQGWVLAASLIFYAGSGIRFVPLLLASAAVNWMIGRALGAPGFEQPVRRRIVVFGLCANVVVLCVSKYTHFALDTVSHFVNGVTVLPVWGFPLGISFFTIAQVMYLVDCYERLIPPSSAFDHFTFVSFFPNVTAGPLERVKHFRSQLSQLGGTSNRDERLARSIVLIALGLFKKVVLADSFARFADAGYGTVTTLSTAGAWLTSLAYAFQLYYDFSGYSDLAFGIAQLLGIELVQNFNSPFRAATMSEFWQRWHISLSNFIARYLFTPILRTMGRATTRTATLAAVFSMTIAGFWHGPAWTYVTWGFMQGVGIAAYQNWKRAKRPLPRPFDTMVTFAFVNLTMILFRAPSMATAWIVISRLFPTARPLAIGDVLQRLPAETMHVMIVPVLFGIVAAFAGPTAYEIASTFRPSRRAALAVVAVCGVSFLFMMSGTNTDFVYRAF